MPNRLLIVDDEDSIRLTLKKFFELKGFDVLTAEDGKSAVELARSRSVEVVLLDLKLPDITGLEALEAIKRDDPTTGVIMLTAYGDVATAVQAMKLKADNFVLKPIELATLEALVKQCLESYRTQSENVYLKQKVSDLKDQNSPGFIRLPPEVDHTIQLVAGNPSSVVLLLGETGTGKGTVASLIHERSARRERNFVDINCAGLRSELLESELFGHERGAFTDAKMMKKGLLEVARGGSVFLDEIGELSPAVQAKLLKVIEQKSFRRLGGTANIEVDVRIIAATNTDLGEAVREGKFREDLFYRLSVVPIVLPPLRERSGDILPLAGGFLKNFNSAMGKGLSGFSPEVEEMLLNYSWPGNVREMRNVIERAVLLGDGDVLEASLLPESLRRRTVSRPVSLEEDLSLENLEKRHIQMVLSACGQNRSRAARILGIHRSTLIKKSGIYNL